MSVYDYTITAPFKVLASDTFEDWVSNFSSLSLNGMVDQSSDHLEKYGLDQPAYTLKIGYSESNPGGTGDFTMMVGNLTEDEESYYVAFEGEEGVYTLKASLFSFITDLNAFTLTNRYFMLYAITYVDKITISYGDVVSKVEIKHVQSTEDPTKMTSGENKYFGGLLYPDLSPKPIYKALDKLINHEWHTESVLTTDGNGFATINGFKGDYELEIYRNEKKLIKSTTVDARYDVTEKIVVE